MNKLFLILLGALMTIETPLAAPAKKSKKIPKKNKIKGKKI